MSEEKCQQVKRILILSANPRGTSKLRLDEEIREIKEGLRRSKQRDQYSIDTAEAARYRDIHRAILDYEPQIIHFSGHGAGEEGLAVEDEAGQVKLVDAKAIAGMFKLVANQVECVVLNACYSKVQAEEIARHIDYVVGMSQEIGDRAAIEFAIGFYGALGAGKRLNFAYDWGCSAIRTAGIEEHLTPVLLKKSDIGLLQWFNLEKEDTFSTRDARVKVNLKIFVTAKITNLEGIKNYLEQQLDVQELMKNSIYDFAREYLTQIEPERFYMRFLQHDKELNETKSVEKELSEKIKKELENKFSAQVSIVVPRLLDTEITKCYQSLNSQIGHFEFEILSLQGGEAVTYQGDFQVQAVEKNSWYIFQSRMPSINDIKFSIERSLIAKLNRLDIEQFQNVDLTTLSVMENAINNIANENIIEQFGLEIRIRNISLYRYSKGNTNTRASSDGDDEVEIFKNMNNSRNSSNQRKIERIKKDIELAEQEHEIISRKMSVIVKRFETVIDAVEKDSLQQRKSEFEQELDLIENKIDQLYLKIDQLT